MINLWINKNHKELRTIVPISKFKNEGITFMVKVFNRIYWCKTNSKLWITLKSYNPFLIRNNNPLQWASCRKQPINKNQGLTTKLTTRPWTVPRLKENKWKLLLIDMHPSRRSLLSILIKRVLQMMRKNKVKMFLRL